MGRGVSALPNSYRISARSAGILIANSAETLDVQGATTIGFLDASTRFTGATVQTVLDEFFLKSSLTRRMTDPGTAVAIPVTGSGSLALTVAVGVAETNTLAIPTFVGQQLAIWVDTLGAAGTRAITSAQIINQATNTVMTFGAARDFILLEAITAGSALRWQVLYNDGVALS